MAAIPSVKRLRQENHHELEDSLSYIMNSNPGWAQSKTLSQKTKTRPTAAQSLRSHRQALKMVGYLITAGAKQNSEHVCAGVTCPWFGFVAVASCLSVVYYSIQIQ